MKRTMVIAQSGGPSMVINQSLAGAVDAARASGRIGGILGARHGIAGILGGDFADMRKIAPAKMKAIAQTPSSALGSVRRKPTAEDCRALFETFRRMAAGWFFYIGGNDSADAARIVAEAAKAENYPLCVYHIPKTIDNDLRSCDHTPGYGSAAKFVAMAFMGDDLDNRALGGVKIDVVMGRDAGFLTAAAALARTSPDSGPHLIYMPERPFSPERFAQDVKAAVAKYGRCVAAVSEGIRDEAGVPVAARFAGGEKDSHGNLQLSGTGALGDMLAKYIKEQTGISRVRADTFGYLQRSFPGIASPVDSAEAYEAGAAAVRFALAGLPSGSVGIRRAPGKKYGVRFERVDFSAAAKTARSMPARFIARNGHDVTPAFVEYARPLAGPLPRIETI